MVLSKSSKSFRDNNNESLSYVRKLSLVGYSKYPQIRIKEAKLASYRKLSEGHNFSEHVYLMANIKQESIKMEWILIMVS